MTDPDSVELTFVFRNDGGYVLGIAPEYSRLERRCLGFDRSHLPMVFAPTWFKPIDTVHPMLREFRQYCRSPIAPFLFDGVSYSGSKRALTSNPAAAVRQVAAITPLLKFDVTFVDELDAKPGSLGWFALKAAARLKPDPPGKPPDPKQRKPETICKHRRRALAHHFPVTLERIRRYSAVPALLQDLSADVRLWQLEQSLCNLVLSADLQQGPHFSKMTAQKFDRNLIDALRDRHEIADESTLPAFSIEDLRTQILADANALLRFLDKDSVTDLPHAQIALRSAGMLDAVGALDRPASWAALQ